MPPAALRRMLFFSLPSSFKENGHLSDLQVKAHYSDLRTIVICVGYTLNDLKDFI